MSIIQFYREKENDVNKKIQKIFFDPYYGQWSIWNRVGASRASPEEMLYVKAGELPHLVRVCLHQVRRVAAYAHRRREREYRRMSFFYHRPA